MSTSRRETVVVAGGREKDILVRLEVVVVRWTLE
jgi:hypothetical protein